MWIYNQTTEEYTFILNDKKIGFVVQEQNGKWKWVRYLKDDMMVGGSTDSINQAMRMINPSGLSGGR